MDYIKNIKTKAIEEYDKIARKTQPADQDIWKADQNYKSGDKVKLNKNSKFYECQPNPYGDFCNLSPSVAGGRMAWKLDDEEKLPMSSDPVSCRSFGHFDTN